MRQVIFCGVVSSLLLWVSPPPADACGIKLTLRMHKSKRHLVQRQEDRPPTAKFLARIPIKAGPGSSERRRARAGGGDASSRAMVASGASGTASTSVSGSTAPDASPGSAGTGRTGADDAADNGAAGRERRVATATGAAMTTDTDRTDGDVPPRRAAKPRARRAKFTDRVHFGNGSATLSGKWRVGLEQTAKWLADHPDKSITIQGHASTVGNADLNQSLSEMRADAVKDFLVPKGIDASRITTKGLGSTQPQYSPGSNPRNRRAVIVVD